MFADLQSGAADIDLLACFAEAGRAFDYSGVEASLCEPVGGDGAAYTGAGDQDVGFGHLNEVLT